jgi:hypothetical protein
LLFMQQADRTNVASREAIMDILNEKWRLYF